MTQLCKGIETRTSMDLNYFNDFYYLEALKAGIASKIIENPIMEFSHSVEKLLNDIEIYKEELIPNMAKRTFVYIYAACLGEARHARNGTEKSFIQETLMMDRGDLFEKITNFPPTQENIKAVIDVFSQDWKSGFGGKMWLQIAKSLKLYFEVPPATFLDHVVDLQHNNGTVFSKDESKYALKFTIRYNGSFTSFLDYKFHRNILTQEPGFFMSVTRKTRTLLDRYETIFRAKRTHWVVAESQRLDEYIVNWGCEKLTNVVKWAAWADCHKGNQPNVRWLINELTSRCGWFTMTEKQAAKKWKSVKSQGNKTLKPFGKKLVQEFHEKLEEQWKQYKRYFKVEKQKVTYTNIPLKMSVKGIWLTLQFKLPYYGWGKETEYGFEAKEYTQGIYQESKGLGYDGREGFSDAMAMLHGEQIKIYSDGYIWNVKIQKMEAILE